MLGVIAYWSIHPWITAHKSGPKRWISLWAYPLLAFGGTDLILIGKDVPPCSGFGLNFRTYPDLESVLKDYKKARLVVLVGRTPEDIKITSLKDYKHPKKDTLYMVGPDYGDVEFGKLKKIAKRCDFVTIKTPEESSAMWGHVCTAIALYDRSKK